MNRRHFFSVLSSAILLFSCGSQALKHDTKKDNEINEVENKIWFDFKSAIDKRDSNYFLNNSLDTIHCVDCVLDVDKRIDENYSAKFLFEKHLDEVSPPKNADRNLHSVSFSDDSSKVIVDYVFPNSNLFYFFVKDGEKYKFSERISVP